MYKDIYIYTYIYIGEKQPKFLIDYPETYKMLESFTQKPKLMMNIPFSYAFISILKKQSKIAAHYGPCNLRIRYVSMCLYLCIYANMMCMYDFNWGWIYHLVMHL
jgi:hypothetical protein